MVCSEVRRLLPEAQLVVGDRRADRGAETARRVGARAAVLDAEDPDSIRTALRGADTVIIALGQQEPRIQTIGLELGVHCVDVTADGDMTARVSALDDRARTVGTASIAMAGLFPGLSGLLAQKAAARLERVDHVDVTLLQSTNGNVGRAGVRDMLGIIASPVDYRGRVERGFRRRWPGDGKLRLIDHTERRVLAGECGLESTAYWTGWDGAVLTAAVSLLVRARLLPRLAPRLAALSRHDSTKPEKVELGVHARGADDGREAEVRLSLTADSDYGATACAAVALAALVSEGGATGAGTPKSFTDFDTLTSRMRTDRIRIRP